MSIAIISDKGRKILNFLKSGIQQGLSSSRIISALREAGASTYRRTEMLADIRALRDVEDVFNRLKYIRRDSLISESHYLQTRKVMTSRYKTVVRIEGISKITGEEMTRYITVSHDSLIKRGEAEAAALYALEVAESPTKWEKMYPVESYLTA